MTVNACAEIVKQGDPDRFLATMAAPPAARAVLFPLYAFNVEVARAPWVTQEPMIAQMRLQWWRDALDEIAQGGIVRRHEVVVPLAGVIDGPNAQSLQSVIDARERDIDATPFTDLSQLEHYLAQTGGTLMAVATRALGGSDDDSARRIGQAGAAANYLLALPALIAKGRQPLPGDPNDAIKALATTHLALLNNLKDKPSPALSHATLAAWRARAILTRANADPQKARDGQLEGAEFIRRATLLKAQLFGL